MTPSWRDPDLFPRLALALTVGQSAAETTLSCYQKPLLTKQLWFTHITNRTWQGINREGSEGAGHLRMKGNYNHNEEKRWDRTKLPKRGGRERDESGERPGLNTSSQLGQGRKTMGF